MSYLDDRRKFIEAGRPLPDKKTYKLKPVSDKRASKEAAQKLAQGDGDTEKQKWFKGRVKHMTGYCAETGLKNETKIYAYAIRSVCHILPQESCPSVKYHILNWIELNCDFHVKFDAMSWEERERLGCWPIIRDRLIMVYSDLDPLEYRHFPQSVLDYMEKNKPF